MNCQETKKIIHAYIDGELDATHSMAVESHLQDCPGCSRAQNDLQTLKSTLSGSELRFETPASLRRRIVSELRPAAPSEPRGRLWWPSWVTGGAVALTAALLAFFLATTINPSTSQNQLMAEITSSHVRSMMANHLMDVVSTDQHTVKPWFDGKLDFAPPVKDLANQGFPLSGGRLEYLDGHPAAALVYLRQKHIINIFVWPSSVAAQTPGPAVTRNGYHLVHWMESGMIFWAVSDLNETELLQFAETFRKN